MNTKRSLFTSLISLVLCFAMLLGTTFAWFTDSVTSSGNKIQAGTLKLDLHVLKEGNNNEWYSIKNESAPLFTYENWEPGYTDVTILKVENKGNLALKWVAKFFSEKALSELAKVIDVYVLPGATAYPTDRTNLEAEGWTKTGTLDAFINSISTTTYGYLDGGESATLGIALQMQESAGNEYQNMTLGEFDIRIVATQLTKEEDSFGPDYDENASWPEVEGGASATASVNNGKILYGALTEEITIIGEGFSATLPEGVKLADGVKNVKLTVKSVDTNGNLTLGDGDSASSFDVHIEGIADDNTTPITVFLGAILEPGLGDTELKLYHEDVQMTRVDSVSLFGNPDQFTYNSVTGEVVIYVNNFSVFSAVKTEADKWDGNSDTSWYNENDSEFTLTTAEQFAGFRDLVDGGNTFEGKTVILGTDIDLANIPFDPIGFGYYKDDKKTDGQDTNTVFLGTFDGGNHTIYNLYQNCWELDPDKTNYGTYTYSTAGAGLFASIKDATIKNLAISGAEIVFECVDMGIVVGYAQGECHFENIIVANSKIANYNRYTGGVVGEVSYGTDSDDDGYSHTFKNITVDSTVKVCGLWGSFGCGMGGVIGGKWGDATVKMENVISAPVMDVYNDVVSAYQWYAFRGCGMLIGHTEEPYSDGRTSGTAKASFLTCENVKVYYGDWVNYHYYEFANQESGTGRNYPWVRAEAGEYCDAFSNIRYGVPTHDGVKVSDLTEEELKDVATNYTPIIFDQLYGADRGMYGQAEHKGVSVSKKNVKTLYIHNNESWTNLKLEYWYKNGEDTWTNLGEGIDISEQLLENNVYKIEVPIYAYAFKITADNENEREFLVSDVKNNGFYTLVGEHSHEYDTDGECICGCKKVVVNIKDYASANGWENAKQYTSIVANQDINITATAAGNNAKYYTNGNNWRIYQVDGGSFTITSSNGNILSVTIKYDIDNNGVLKLGGANVASGTTVDINASSVTFGVGNTESAANGQVRITSIEVVYSTVLACDHTNTITETHEPTCTMAGYTATTCVDCGKVMSRIEGDPATEHDKHSIVEKEVTCTENGLKTYTCSKCDWSYSENINAKGHVNGEGEVTTPATCTTEGVKTYTCEVCGETNTEAIEATGHSFDEGVVKTEATCTTAGEKTYTCTACEETTTEVIAALGHTTENGVCGICGQTIGGATESGWIKTDLADIKADDIVVIVWTKSDTSWAISSANGSSSAPAAKVVTVSGNQLTGNIADELKWNISNSEGNLTIYPNGTTATWLYCTSTNNGVRVGTNANKVFTIDANSGYLKNTATNRYVGVYTTNPDVRCYTSTGTNINDQTIAFYVYNAGTSGGETVCEHTNTSTTTVDATCKEDGSVTVTCDDCGATVSTEAIPKTGIHNYVDGTCTVCGDADPDYNAGGETETHEATLSFADKANRTSYSTSKQVWEQNGIKFTNNKSSGNNVGDYAEPVRLYANSNVVIEVSDGSITKIVFDCNTSGYATALKNSIGTVIGVTVTVSSDKVTVEFTSPVNSFTIAKLTAQVRLDSITVTHTK